MANGQRRKQALSLSKKLLENNVFRFLISGGTSTAVDIVVYFIVFNFILYKQPVEFLGSIVSGHTAALCISFSAGFITNFFISKYFVFSNSNLQTRIQLFRYLIVASVNFGANYFLLKFFVEFLNWYPTPSRALAAMIVAVMSFLLGKYFAFKVKTA
ncbi:GtrA family protein [Solitalea lacus]|uniref:GtrA family protein n=1 Tax=Solitalea lacus TaxID=2911172 RepID=UPI001EDBE2B4|nr:GtrA family protein [Solitalea lacus]UKJ06057.1 GtrA family protein [Solitalea lacus]